MLVVMYRTIQYKARCDVGDITLYIILSKARCDVGDITFN